MKEIYFGLKEGDSYVSSFIPFYKHTYETPVFVRKNQIFTIQWADDLDEKEMKSFNFKKQELLNSVFEIHHEINEDDMRLEFERKILVFDYEKNQREPIISDLPKINTVS